MLLLLEQQKTTQRCHPQMKNLFDSNLRMTTLIMQIIFFWHFCRRRKQDAIVVLSSSSGENLCLIFTWGWLIVTYPTVTSNMLLPTEEETAISPKPFRATITEVMRSGMEVPAAKKVKPITSGGIWTASPTIFAHQTIRYE